MKKGRIELAVGPMFAGKTSWLIKKLEKFPPQEIVAIRSHIDTRYSLTELVSHDKKRIKATTAKNEEEILKVLEENSNASVLGIDELQFFKPSIVSFLENLKKENKIIFVSGLDLDHAKKFWETTKETLKIADKIYNLKAICSICGKKNATLTHLKRASKSRQLIGGKELYQAVCEKDYYILGTTKPIS